MKLLHSEVTDQVLASFFAVYECLGYGFLESVYARALELELRARGLLVEREVPMEVRYKSRVVGFFRADMLVERVVVLEVKATPAISDADQHQLLNCLRGTRLEVGLLLHFGPKPRFKRLVATNESKRLTAAIHHSLGRSLAY